MTVLEIRIVIGSARMRKNENGHKNLRIELTGRYNRIAQFDVFGSLRYSACHGPLHLPKMPQVPRLFRLGRKPTTQS